MKNLRKVLAVVLVIALAFSMMVIASAKQVSDYSDSSSIKYTEAVDLLTGLGILQGGGGTTFNPNDTLTREQAAKIITYMILGTTVANSLTTSNSSFKDVEVTRWSAPFIQYCAVNGIIGGDGTGNFNPTAPVTGSQMAKLLLCAIGYGAKGEFTGANWELNSLVKAQSLGILSTGVNYTAPATRQEVAQYVFNALTLDACGATTYNPVLGTYADAGDTLGATVFGLLKKDLTNSYYGKTAHYWQANSTTTPVTVSATYSDDTVLTTSSVGNPFGIANMTTPNSGFYKATLDYSTGVQVVVNGQAIGTMYGSLSALTATVPAFTVNGTSYTSISGLIGMAGVTTKMLDNDKNGLAEILYIYVYGAARATAAPSVDAAGSVTITATANSGIYPKASISCPTGINANDYFTFANWNNGVLYIQKATTGSGTVTASTNILVAPSTYVAINATINGKAYSLAGYTGTSFMSTLASSTNSFNMPVTYWLDQNGYAIYIQGTVAASYNYGVVLAYAYSTSGVMPSAQVQLLTSDGKIAIYNVAADSSTGLVPDQTAGTSDNHGSATIGTMVSYSFDGSNNVTMYNVDNLKYGYQNSGTALTGTGYGQYGTIVPLESDPNAFGTTFNSGNYIINSNTKVFYFDPTVSGGYNASSNPAAVLTGSGATKAVGTSVPVAFVCDPMNNTVINAIYFAESGPSISSGNFVYLTSAAYTLRVVNGINYYDYSGYVNGATTKTVLTATSDMVTTILNQSGKNNGLFTYNTDASGNVTSFVQLSGSTGLSGVTHRVNYVDSGIVGYNNGTSNLTFKVDSNTKFFQINPISGAVVAAPMVASTAGSTTTLYSVALNTNVSGSPALYVYYTVS